MFPTAPDAHSRRYDAVHDPEVLRERNRSITVCVPVYNEIEGVARTVDQLSGLVTDGLIDGLVMIDGGSDDGSFELAESLLAEVVSPTGVGQIGAHRAASLAPEVGAVLGKGDSMWRANALIDTDVTVFLDADLLNVGPHMVVSLAAPLVHSDDVDFAKGLFHRVSDRSDPREYDGGRVTELMARPLLNLLCPELAAFYQPLGGQIAIRSDLLKSLPIFTGYGVEIGMLIDVAARLGIGRIGEVELGDLMNSEKSDGALLPMAQQVAYTLLRRSTDRVDDWVPATRPTFDGGMVELDGTTVVERPPWSTRP